MGCPELLPRAELGTHKQSAVRPVRIPRPKIEELAHQAQGVYTTHRVDCIPPLADDMQFLAKLMIIKRRESVLAQASERRLLLGALGEAEQSAKRKAQRCSAPKGVYATLRVDYIPPRN